MGRKAGWAGGEEPGFGFQPSPASAALLAEMLLPSFPPREKDRDWCSSLFPKGCLQEASLVPQVGLFLCCASDAGQNRRWERAGATQGAAGQHVAVLPPLAHLRSVLPGGLAGHVTAALVCETRALP